MPDVTIERQVDTIDEDHFSPDIAFGKGRWKRYFIDNVFTRALSYLVGWTGEQVRMLRCTTAGILLTANVGGGFEDNETVTGTSGGAWSADIIPGEQAAAIDIWVDTNDMNLRRSANDFAWNDTIMLPSGSYYRIEASTYRVGVMNAGVGNADYRLVFWY